MTNKIKLTNGMKMCMHGCIYIHQNVEKEKKREKMLLPFWSG